MDMGFAAALFGLMKTLLMFCWMPITSPSNLTFCLTGAVVRAEQAAADEISISALERSVAAQVRLAF